MAKRKASSTRSSSGPASADLIRREAIRLFGERSYPVVGMRDIADAVGILPGSLYAHISSKEDLLLSIVEEGILRYLQVIEPWAESAEPASVRLREAIKAHVRVLAATQGQTTVAFQQWRYVGEANLQRVVDLRLRYEGAFTRIIQEGIDSGEFRAVASRRIAVLGAIGMLTAAANWYLPEGSLGPDEVGEILADQALAGFQK